MRLCLVSTEVAPFFGAGIGSYIAHAARAWASAGAHTHILSANHHGMLLNGPRLFPRVRFHAVEALAGHAERQACRFDFQRHALDAFRTLERLHDEHHFNYIEFPDYLAEGYFAISAKRLLRKFHDATLAVRLHTPTALCRRLNNELARPDHIATLEHMEAAAIRHADLLISPSASLLDWARDTLDLPPGQTAGIARYPFDLSQFPQPPIPPDPPTTPTIPTILYFGRLERRKGVETLVDAAIRIIDSAQNVRFRLIGGDTNTAPGAASMLAHLKSRSVGLHDRILFEPPVPRERLAPIIRQADICCFPALWDNFPNTCLEAMALGACTVASDSGGMAEIIEDGTSGILFQGGNATNLVSTLRRVLADPDLRALTAANAPARIRRLCNPRRSIKDTLALIRSARRAPAPPPPAGAPLTLPIPLISDQSPNWLARRLATIVRKK